MTELPSVVRAGAGETIINEAVRTDLLLSDLTDARARTLALAADLPDERLVVPKLDVINPILWELGHIAYFAEFWILRHVFGCDPMISGADALYDSAKVAHDARWTLPLPSRTGTLAFMERQLDAIVTRGIPQNSDARYFYELALRHEDMHAEALVYTRQLLGYPAPSYATERAAPGGALTGDVRVPAGRYTIGALPDDGFVFDNEKWAHEVDVRSFEIARAPVTNAEFAAFLADRGYQTRKYWSEEGWRWRENEHVEAPAYWNLEKRTRRSFDRDVPIREHEPVCNVSKFEADAYCAWAGRRLPTEAEWEVAATGGGHVRYPWGAAAATKDRANLDGIRGGPGDVDSFESGDSPAGCRQMMGNVWEWTASPFAPYPGFAVDPYAEYSQPWFSTHYTLRGGAWTTRSRLISTRWRNFYGPHRRDVMTGFRTVR